MCTNTSLPPFSGVMNPNPLPSLKNFTVPLAMSLLISSLRFALRFPFRAQNLHVGLPRITIFPSALDEVAQLRHVLLDGRLPKIRIVFEHAEHVVDVEEWPCAFGLHEYHRLLLRDPDAELKHDVRVVLGQVGYYEVGFDEVVHDGGLNHVAALAVGCLDGKSALL